MTGSDPEITIYGPEWTAARNRLASVRPAEAGALLASAMDRVESGWSAVLPLHQWLERNRGRDSAEDDYGCLLTYAETDVRETFRSLAVALAHVAADWPDWERASTEDVTGLLSTFVRYVTVLGLATDAATVPPEFGKLVRQVAPLGLSGEWFRQLSGVVKAIEGRATATGTVQDAQAAVEFLTAALPEAGRARASAALLTSVEALYALAGPPPPEWLGLVREYFAGRADDANPSEA